MEEDFKIVICDDDSRFLDELYKQISQILLNINCRYEITSLYSGAELLEHCKKNIVDIVLVDIDMPNMTGFDAVKSLQKYQPELPVIFITAHEEYAFQAYDYQPFWFVSKMQMKTLSEVLSKLIKKLNMHRCSNEIFHLRLEKIYSINVNEIIYFKSNKHYISSYSINGMVGKYRCGVREAYLQLQKAGFIYVHRSYLINCRYIERFDTQYIFLTNKEKIPLTRNMKVLREAQNIYGKFMRDTRW